MRTILAAAVSAVILASFLSYGIAGPPATPAAIYAADPEGKIYKIDPNRQQVVASRPVKFSPVALWSYDGKLLAADAEHDKGLIIVDPATGSSRRLSTERRSSLNCIYVNNGTVVAGTLGPPGLVKIDLASGRRLASVRLPEGSHPFSLAVTPDGRAYVADTGTKSLHVIDLRTWTFLGHYSTPATYTNICLGKDGKLYATVSNEDSLGEWIDVWDTRKNVRIQSIRGLLPMEQSFLPEEGPVSQRHMVFIDDLNLLCALSFLNPGIKITSKRWPLLIAVDVTSGKLAWCLKQSSATEEPNIILRGPDHNLYLATNKRIALIDAKTGKVKKDIPLKNIWGMTR